MDIRDANPADMAAIAEIHNELIDTTTYTWTEQHQSVAERLAGFEARLARGFPTLVAADAGEIYGVATYADFRDSIKWPGYRFTVEHSVNVRGDAWRRGVGRQLMLALLDRSRAAGIHVMVGAVDASNVRSIDFHERLGFREVARMPETGWKHGRWCDLVLMQRFVNAG